MISNVFFLRRLDWSIAPVSRILSMNMPTCTLHEICILTTEVLHQFDIDSYNICHGMTRGFSWNHLPSNFGRFPTEEKRLTSEQYMDHVRTKGQRGSVVLRGARSGDPNLVGNFLEPTKHTEPIYVAYTKICTNCARKICSTWSVVLIISRKSKHNLIQGLGDGKPSSTGRIKKHRENRKKDLRMENLALISDCYKRWRNSSPYPRLMEPFCIKWVG